MICADERCVSVHNFNYVHIDRKVRSYFLMPAQTADELLKLKPGSTEDCGMFFCVILGDVCSLVPFTGKCYSWVSLKSYNTRSLRAGVHEVQYNFPV